MDIIIFFLSINIITFFICLFDKILAKKRKFRISEKIFIFMSMIGGFVGFLFATKLFHHKTKHKKLLFFVYFTSILWFLFLIKIIYDKIIIE